VVVGGWRARAPAGNREQERRPGRAERPRRRCASPMRSRRSSWPSISGAHPQQTELTDVQARRLRTSRGSVPDHGGVGSAERDELGTRRWRSSTDTRCAGPRHDSRSRRRGERGHAHRQAQVHAPRSDLAAHERRTVPRLLGLSLELASRITTASHFAIGAGPSVRHSPNLTRTGAWSGARAPRSTLPSCITTARRPDDQCAETWRRTACCATRGALFGRRPARARRGGQATEPAVGIGP
jgi:hypothetical protein